MQTIMTETALRALRAFSLPQPVQTCDPYGNGHINGTFLVTCGNGDTVQRYILQAVNTDVFSDPQQLMENIERVTAFLKSHTAEPRAVLTLLPTADGRCYHTENGICWRVYDFIEDAVSPERLQSAEDIYQCAYAFGAFQRDLNAYPAEQLHETIADFHNTPKRYRDLLAAVQADVCHLAEKVAEEIAFFRERAGFYDTLLAAHRAGRLPLRVTHNDTKCNNVMLDAATRQALCVIDLDTVMPGFSVTDFGDAIRFGANTAAEDEPDVSKVHFNLDFFAAYVKGYIAGCGGLLKDEEIRLLPEGALMMTLECGMRFLEDHLKGNVYFKTAYATHNLVRCHTQMRLAQEMEMQMDAMRQLLTPYLRNQKGDAEV